MSLKNLLQMSYQILQIWALSHSRRGQTAPEPGSEVGRRNCLQVSIFHQNPPTISQGSAKMNNHRNSPCCRFSQIRQPAPEPLLQQPMQPQAIPSADMLPLNSFISQANSGKKLQEVSRLLVFLLGDLRQQCSGAAYRTSQPGNAPASSDNTCFQSKKTNTNL